MTTPLMSIIALYNWDNTIFDFFNVPEPLDKEELENNLMMELGELSVIYSEPTFLKWAIGQWSSKQAPIWKKLYDTTQFDYNPIHNYDRTEYYEDIRQINKTGNENSTSDNTLNNSSTNKQNTNSNTISSENVNDTTTREVSAYNMENSFAPAEKSTENKTTSGNNNFENIENSEYSENETTNSKTESENSENTNESFNHKYHGEGNIGVTTTQQMIEAEREVVKFNIYDYIIEEFKQRFCILVY